MSCAEFSRALLEADLAELEGHVESPLARHLKECPRCATLAKTILDREKSLALELASAVPSPDLDWILETGLASSSLEPATDTPDAVKATEAAGKEDPAAREALKGLLPFRTRRLGLTLLPLAAAAALAALFLRTEPQLPGEPYRPPPETPGLGLEVPEGQNVAVLDTNDPDITVLWFF